MKSKGFLLIIRASSTWHVKEVTSRFIFYLLFSLVAAPKLRQRKKNNSWFCIFSWDFDKRTTTNSRTCFSRCLCKQKDRHHIELKFYFPGIDDTESGYAGNKSWFRYTVSCACSVVADFAYYTSIYGWKFQSVFQIRFIFFVNIVIVCIGHRSACCLGRERKLFTLKPESID